MFTTYTELPLLMFISHALQCQTDRLFRMWNEYWNVHSLSIRIICHNSGVKCESKRKENAMSNAAWSYDEVMDMSTEMMMISKSWHHLCEGRSNVLMSTSHGQEVGIAYFAPGYDVTILLQWGYHITVTSLWRQCNGDVMAYHSDGVRMMCVH